MKKQFLLVFVFGWFASANTYGYPMICGIQTDQLLNAPVIVIGQIDWMTNAGIGVIKDTIRGHGNVPANIIRIGVNVEQVIKGVSQTNIQVGELLMPADFINFSYLYSDQIPNPASKLPNVFFISPSKNASKYIPTFPKEFAIEIEHRPKKETNSPVEMLRAIAKANVDGSNYVLAVRWAGFLSGLHDDFLYWTNKTQEARALIRSTAYSTLVQDFPQTPGLRTNLVKCLSVQTPVVEDSDVSVADYSLISSLQKFFEKDPPKAEELRSLLISGDKNVNEMALKWIRGKKNLTAMENVAHLMATSKDRDVQYECIKTLSVLVEYPHLISYPKFMTHPDQYLEEWQKTAQGFKQKQ